MRSSLFISIFLLFSTSIFSQDAQKENTPDTKIEELEAKEKTPLEPKALPEGKGLAANFKKKQANKEAPVEKRNFGGLLLKTFFSLGLVLALIAFLFWVLKKVNRRVGGINSSEQVRIQSRTFIDGKNSLVLVRLYEEELLLGVSPNGVNTLARYSLIDKEDENLNEEDPSPNLSDKLPLRKAINLKDFSVDEQA